MLSRGAFEANVASFFIVLGIWAFLSGVQDKKWYLIISAVSFALSMHTFNTSRIVAPLLVILLAIVFRKVLWQDKKQVFLSFIIGLLILLPLIPFLLTPQASLRFKEVNIFSNPEIVKKANQQIENDNNALWSKLLNNRRVLYSLDFAKHYLDNLSPSFLFIKGDGNPKFSTQEVGQMYIWDIIFFVGGIFLLFRKREGNWWIIPLWILIGILPAATARETPHALRIETTLPAFQIIAAFGFVSVFEMINRYKKAVYGVLFALLFVNVAYFSHYYYAHYPKAYSGEWQFGYKQSVDYVKSVEKNYDYIQVTTALGRPYIYYLFYNKSSPEEFRNSSKIKREAFGFVKVEKVGKYLFPENYDYSRGSSSKVLYINTPYKLPEDITILKTFYLLNGVPALVAYTR